ncbi:MAG TPA: FAD-linked oxidase C-terminal domain-containing protein [Blastocatellia bacterium]|nr:FAD-linked oxidase C-terminal domain-containing protein [Blastocatellia bacterium]
MSKVINKQKTQPTPIERTAIDTRNIATGERASLFKNISVDAEALADELSNAIKGEVRFDAGSRALYATDSSNYRQVPIGVVIPKDKQDVIETVRIAREFGAPVLARGGGTSLAGQCCNVAVVMDMSKYMNRILELDAANKRARIEPGTILDHLRDAAERFNLTFGPDPSTHNHCTLGGMIGNNSCGVHSVMAGTTADNVEELEVLTYDGLRLRVGRTGDEELDRIINEGGRRGEIYSKLKALRDKYADLIRTRYPNIARRVSGYNLPALLPENGFHVARALVGSECTCVTILEATVRLVNSPPTRSLLVLGYESIYEAGDHILEVLDAEPIGLEGMDDYLINDMIKKRIHPQEVKLLPDGNGWLLVEFGGATKQEADLKARALMDRLKKQSNAPTMKLFDDPDQERTIWLVRESGLGATARVPGEKDTWEGWEDSAVPPERLGDYLRALRKLFEKYDYQDCSLYGHFGQGCVHTRIPFDLASREGIEKFRAFLYEAADLVVSFEGSFSGEHGDGQSRAELLPKMFGAELIKAFREFKSIWDPEWRMNPGKVVDAYRVDENLRLGASYNPKKFETHFKYPDDDGSFARATLRCVGVGECRRDRVGTMCPSYRVTREEMHSTRGRAHLLFEMLEGDPIKDGWRDEHIKDALDLCLACKGCKHDCPMNVDMATYKTEFLSHYYDGRLRPRHAYAMGLIDLWARLAQVAPRVVNFITHAPIIGGVVKRLGGIAPQREVPRFAPETFKDWFRKRGARSYQGARVILWPDTFNNYFYPEVLKAALEILEAAGFEVIVPHQRLCCGRPLYDFGMLERARRLLANILEALRQDIREGVPVVGLEPSCVAVFKDEMVNLSPNDEDAKRLSRQSYTFSEFLAKHDSWFNWPRIERRAIVHGHCHEKAIIGMDAEREVLKKIGVDAAILDSGCCGMAGSFGFEKEHYDVSIAVGEHELLPAVRSADKGALIIADGFSCREQIAQTTDRRALHTAQVIQMAMRYGPDGLVSDYPETHFSPLAERRSINLQKGALLGASAAVAVGAFFFAFKKWRKS